MPASADAFSDLYLPADDPRAGDLFPGPLPIPESLYPFVERLVEACNQQSQTDFSVRLDGEAFRAHRMPTLTGTYYVLRRMPSRPWTLEECGFAKSVRKQMLSARLSEGGLAIVAGMPGNGKSTTCAAWVSDRLKAHGGLCLTVEDPIEMPLQGRHGNGLCLQRGLQGQEDFSLAVHDAMRGYPAQSNTMLLIGEVRDGATAGHALRASIDGRLVILTLHAGSVIQGLQRFLSLGANALGEPQARELFASGFRMLIHQRMVEAPERKTADADAPEPPKRLRYSVLFDTLKVSSTIGSGTVSLNMLKDEVTNQQRLLKTGRLPDLRPL